MGIIATPKRLSTDDDRVKWLLDVTHTLSNIVSDLEDEGDRVFFGSTNDADELRSINSLLERFWYSQQPDDEGSSHD